MRLSLAGVILLLFFSACDPEKQSKKQIASLERAGPQAKYVIGLACMEYIRQHGLDSPYSKTLINKLLEHGFFAEAAYAAELLLVKFPMDAELFFLRGSAYRNQLQFGLALNDFQKALKLQPGTASFSAALSSTREEQAAWSEIESMNLSLSASPHSFDILLARADKFYSIRQYDAALYDLGSISKMGAPEDSVYFIRQVAALHKENRRPVETLSEMLEYFRRLRRSP
jgi:tetratricopeptide (TPR) repeat protein